MGNKDAVLLKAPSISSPITDFLGYGLREIAVAEPEKFDIGMGIFLTDDNAGGFYTTVATIVGKIGDRFIIDRPLSHDYLPHNNAYAATLFPLISGINVTFVVLENLVLDGNENETRTLNGCRGGGVFLLGSQRVAKKNLEVRQYNGDAISFQQCTDIEVRDCEIHHNTGSGLHPGSGSVRYVFENNNVHHNGTNGLFYCLRTTHSRCENNRFENNGGPGISVGERDTDHIVRGNVIAKNGAPGIHFRPALANGGDRVLVTQNTIGENCQSEGDAEIVIENGLRQIAITHNQIAAKNHPALKVAPDCEEIYFAENQINDQAQSQADLQSLTETISQSTPASFPPLGPEALPHDGACHLNHQQLAPVEVL
jgi:hypothetical protein